jgi:signal transduction histidine kinase
MRNCYVNIDEQALDQCLSCVIDNAVKYSYNNSIIRIAFSVHDNKFVLDFTNTGIPILPDEIQYIAKRGWRGENAKLVTAEGNGVGLWIGKNVMMGHKGTLEILTTTKSNDTTIKLIFPLSYS